MGEVAAALEDAGQRVTVGGPSSSAGVHGAGRVGRDELDVDLRPTADVVARVGLDTGAHDVPQHVVEPGVVQTEVDETGPRDLDARHVPRRILLDDLGDVGSQLARLAARGLGRDEGHVAGPVTVLASRRPLEPDDGRGLDLQAHQGGAQSLDEVVADHR